MSIIIRVNILKLYLEPCLDLSYCSVNLAVYYDYSGYIIGLNEGK